ncbi:hypothetical protein D6745_05195 [Candidatus Woesearchaeota archaeon]|nr:MAG: hypothetical protein D6745_05195 [Candidatus Woesearchaeota archaeon]
MNLNEFVAKKLSFYFISNFLSKMLGSILKIAAGFFAVLLVINIVLLATGKISVKVFWLLIILIGFIAWKVIPLFKSE